MKQHYILQLIVFIVLIHFKGFGQQEPQFTQYMYNMSVINPAYATNDTQWISLGGLYRMQWVGAVGGPNTGTFFAHVPLNQKVEMGVNVIHDDIGEGILKQTQFNVDFAYLIRLGDNHLSFGLKAGAGLLEANLNGLRLNDPIPDPSFANNISKAFPTIGAGVYYFSENYYIGISTPNFLRNKTLDDTQGVYSSSVQEVHGYATAGYVFDLTPDLKFKPALLSKVAKNTPITTDITANMLYLEKFELGVAYRVKDSFIGMFNVRVLPQLRMGYAYDHTLSEMGRFNSGTHEVFLLFDLYKGDQKRLNSGYDKSPRFF